ncbi:C-C chemokine receptor type 3-like [Chanos chanos]|uniref:C-C chemokine receptor type 3-like n=1 Tax=Chanos chanos TaxID=29144 RepID=A0A6J2UWN2_CHACN|nr:C-C chemokine receptor type 3-like [Chanos chanos]
MEGTDDNVFAGFTLDYTVSSNTTFPAPCNTASIINFGKHFLPRFYYTIFVFSLLGNGVVLFLIYKFEKLTTVTNIFLLNLVASDLMFTFSLPFQAEYHSSEWFFGPVACKLVFFLYSLGFHNSILFLTVTAFDRYLSVVHAVVATQQRSKRYACASSAALWLIATLVSLPEVILFDVKEDDNLGKLCQDTSSLESQILRMYIRFALFLILPLLVVLYCYIRIVLTVISSRISGKWRTVRLIFVIVALFFACWMPYNIVLLIKDHYSSCDSMIQYAQYITRNIAHLYFCINPVFYAFMARKFQNHFRTYLGRYVPFLKPASDFSTASKSISHRTQQSVCM